MPLEEKPRILPPPTIYVERTLAIIKPDAVHKSDEIEEIILQHGFTILQVRFVSSIFLLYLIWFSTDTVYLSTY
jgi:hypothetical protein